MILSRSEHLELVNAMRKVFEEHKGIFDPHFSMICAQNFGVGYYKGFKKLKQNNV